MEENNDISIPKDPTGGDFYDRDVSGLLEED